MLNWCNFFFSQIDFVFLSLPILCFVQEKSIKTCFLIPSFKKNVFLYLSIYTKEIDFFLSPSGHSIFLETLSFLSFYLFFCKNSFVLFLSFSRHVTNLCGDLPRSAICKLEHSSYEKLFLRKFRNQKKTSKIPLLLEERACFLTSACLHLEVFSV